METLAEKCLQNGDVDGAIKLYTSLENINPVYARRAYLLKTLVNPLSVPLSQRHEAICDVLLESALPPAALWMSTSPTVESINKNYQRLVVHVHPDKNPAARAKNAFQSLGKMKELSLDALSRKHQEIAESSFFSEPPTTKREPTKKAPSATGKRSKQKMGPPAGIRLPKLADLKKTKITLSSLKRRDLDSSMDDSEPFSATGHFSTASTDVDEDDIPHLASTVPVFNTQSCTLAKQPSKPSRRASKASSRPTLAKEKGMERDGNGSAVHIHEESPPAAAAASRQESQERSLPRVPTPPPRSVAKDKVVAAKKTSASAGKTPATATGAPAAPTESETLADDKSTTGEGEDGGRKEMDPEEIQHLREQINSMIDNLGRLRLSSTSIRLTSNLTFNHYEHERLRQK